MQHRNNSRLAITLVTTSLVLTGCAPMPTGPSVAVMPAAHKPFEVFVQDDTLCRSWASHSIGIPGHDAAARQLLASTVAGAAIGAAAGALAGGHGSAGGGAAVGTAIGASVGAGQSSATAWNAQQRYDIAYQQCMYSKGNAVATFGAGAYRYAPAAADPPPPPWPSPRP